MLKDLHGRLRPMGLSDILDETAEIYKSNFVLLAGVAGAIYVPYAILSGLIESPNRSPMGAAAAMLVDGAIAFVISSIITGALTYAISERYLAREVSVGGSYRWVFRSGLLWRLIGAIVIKTMIVCAPVMVAVMAGGTLGALAAFQGGSVSSTTLLMLGLIGLFGLGGLLVTAFLGVRLALVEPALVIERCTIGRAISRSWQLLAGNFWPALGVLFIVVVVTSLVSGFIVGPTSLLMGVSLSRHADIGWGMRAVNLVLGGVAHILTAPIMSIVVILLYYDSRIRKEGFDLELLARELDEKSRAFATEGASSLPQEASTAPSAEPAPSEDDSTQ